MSHRTSHGLIIGKFAPPHAGHHMLIRSAATASERVTVVVLARSDDVIPLVERVRWLTTVHAADRSVSITGAIDDHADDFADPAAWDAHVGVIARAVAAVDRTPVSAVFSSESYGRELARRFDAIDVAIDADRALVPVSASMIRSDLVGNWEHLERPVRAGLASRVVVIGAESTGKTTLSHALVDALRRRGGAHGLTRWVPEHGRPYTIDKLASARAIAGVGETWQPTMDELVWTTDEFEVIARVQNRIEDEEAHIGGPVLICDTDAFATGIWHERYLGATSPHVEAIAAYHPLYLLTHHDDVPFAADGIRDGESIRAWMTDRFADALEASGRRTVVLRGSRDERVTAGLAAIDALLASGLAGRSRAGR